MRETGGTQVSSALELTKQIIKEKNLSKTASELKQKLDNYQRFDDYSYPGKNKLESTIELLEHIASIKDTTLFFEEVNNKKVIAISFLDISLKFE